MNKHRHMKCAGASDMELAATNRGQERHVRSQPAPCASCRPQAKLAGNLRLSRRKQSFRRSDSYSQSIAPMDSR